MELIQTAFLVTISANVGELSWYSQWRTQWAVTSVDHYTRDRWLGHTISMLTFFVIVTARSSFWSYKKKMYLWLLAKRGINQKNLKNRNWLLFISSVYTKNCLGVNFIIEGERQPVSKKKISMFTPEVFFKN